MTMTRRSLLIPAVLVALQPAPVHAQTAPPRAEPNDNRTPAGRMVHGELRVELEAVVAAWYPRGSDLPPVMTTVLAEVGHAPQVPGPLIRASAGTPVHVTIRNSLDRPIAVRGLTDRPAVSATTRAQGPAFLPTFAFADPLVVRPGETGEARFTPTAEVSSFYYVRTLPRAPDARAVAASVIPGLDEGAFMGGLVIDASGAPAADERVLMITRWNTPGQGGTWKMMVNGLSWPFTERLEYAVGDTARWRIINASNVDHPMHLHGFYFTVDALGDTHTDTRYAVAERPLVVTQVMQEFSSMRLTWVPERPGNWLFHCHLVRHMGEAQHFAAERAAAASRGHEDEAAHPMDLMAGLITGITVRPSADGEPPDEAPARRIDLWTGERPGIFDGAPELAFVVQDGPEPPAPDSTRVPGSPLVLYRGEPTEIVVHNRLDFPLSVHWHGLELRSLYDGVGGWSGYPGTTRPPIAAGDSVRVLITPPRAGSFMYHTHGEPGHELSQGLYGPFLVLEPGETWDGDADRVYMLASRGATPDAVPAINGRTRPDPERFAPGRTYRLRFLHISADEFKRVRLLKDGEPVSWRPLARDGADLPPRVHVAGPATLGIGVGETYDVAWTPDDAGVYVLEVTTEFFPALGGTVVQRLAFGVGDVADSALNRAQRPPRSIARVPVAEGARYVGTFVGYPVGVGGTPPELVLSLWQEQDRLYASGIMPVEWADEGTPEQLAAVGDHSLAPTRDLDGLTHLLGMRYRFVETRQGLDRVEVEFDGQVVVELERVLALPLTEARLRRFVGAYGPDGSQETVTVMLHDGALHLIGADGSQRLRPISSTRFALEGAPDLRVDFEIVEGHAVALTVVAATGGRTRLEKRD